MCVCVCTINNTPRVQPGVRQWPGTEPGQRANMNGRLAKRGKENIGQNKRNFRFIDTVYYGTVDIVILLSIAHKDVNFFDVIGQGSVAGKTDFFWIFHKK